MACEVWSSDMMNRTFGLSAAFAAANASIRAKEYEEAGFRNMTFLLGGSGRVGQNSFLLREMLEDANNFGGVGFLGGTQKVFAGGNVEPGT
tara:strand:- start:1187 stop:1459 length:273 start_codon:yes stop_codon:yes gene_type:complete